MAATLRAVSAALKCGKPHGFDDGEHLRGRAAE